MQFHGERQYWAGGGAYPDRCHCHVIACCCCRRQRVPSSLCSPHAIVIIIVIVIVVPFCHTPLPLFVSIIPLLHHGCAPSSLHAIFSFGGAWYGCFVGPVPRSCAQRQGLWARCMMGWGCWWCPPTGGHGGGGVASWPLVVAVHAVGHWVIGTAFLCTVPGAIGPSGQWSWGVLVVPSDCCCSRTPLRLSVGGA